MCLQYHYILGTKNCCDAVLRYGHEFSLTIFDMMVFCFVDLFAKYYLLAANGQAGIVTFFIGEVRALK